MTERLNDIRTAIWVPGAWHSGAPYTPAIRHGRLLFTSGLVPVDLKSGESMDGDIRAQTACVLDNLALLLAAAGATLQDVVKVTVYLTDSSMAQEMNAVYERHFSNSYPARSTVQVGPLARPEFLIEIDSIAVTDE
jgi:2-iminobutanoate/2-iminopropanoate deaminase